MIPKITNKRKACCLLTIHLDYVAQKLCKRWGLLKEKTGAKPRLKTWVTNGARTHDPQNHNLML
jgi:hypothetical protein